MTPALVLTAALIVLLALRVPIGLSMLLASGIYLVGFGTIPMTVLPQRLWAGLESFPLLAIPFFVFAGILMNVSGGAERIFSFSLSLCGHLRGGIAHVNVLASMIFAGMSGAENRQSTDACATETTLEGPQATKTAARTTTRAPSTRRVVLGAVLFVGGFAAVFTSYGVLFGTFGSLLIAHQETLVRVLGALTIVFGLMFTGLFWKLPIASRSLRLGYRPRAGLAVVRGNRVVWVLVLAMLPFVVTLESMNAVEVFLARDELGASQAQFGFWQTMTGVGALAGAVAAGWLPRTTG